MDDNKAKFMDYLVRNKSTNNALWYKYSLYHSTADFFQELFMYPANTTIVQGHTFGLHREERND